MTRVTLAAIIGAHGVRGEVRLKLFADSPDSLAAHEQLYVAGQLRRLQRIGGGGKAIVASFAGTTDRNAAEALRGTLVEVDREALPALADDEYYHADLIGLPCQDQSGRTLGTVVAVENYGAGDLLEVEGEGGRRNLIPFKPGIADLSDGRIILDPAFLA